MVGGAVAAPASAGAQRPRRGVCIAPDFRSGSIVSDILPVPARRRHGLGMVFARPMASARSRSQQCPCQLRGAGFVLESPRVRADVSFATRSTRHRDRERGVRFLVCREASIEKSDVLASRNAGGKLATVIRNAWVADVKHIGPKYRLRLLSEPINIANSS